MANLAVFSPQPLDQPSCTRCKRKRLGLVASGKQLVLAVWRSEYLKQFVACLHLIQCSRTKP